DNKFTVKDTINDLVTGRLKPQDLPIICICLNEDNQNNVVVLHLARPNKICQKTEKFG
ncbi:11681_t:CDS:2, partial [Gigaspora rosea]